MTEERKDDDTRSVLEAVNLKKIYGTVLLLKTSPSALRAVKS